MEYTRDQEDVLDLLGKEMTKEAMDNIENEAKVNEMMNMIENGILQPEDL